MVLSFQRLISIQDQARGLRAAQQDKPEALPEVAATEAETARAATEAEAQAMEAGATVAADQATGVAMTITRPKKNRSRQATFTLVAAFVAVLLGESIFFAYVYVDERKTIRDCNPEQAIQNGNSAVPLFWQLLEKPDYQIKRKIKGVYQSKNFLMVVVARGQEDSILNKVSLEYPISRADIVAGAWTRAYAQANNLGAFENCDFVSFSDEAGKELKRVKHYLGSGAF